MAHLRNATGTTFNGPPSHILEAIVSSHFILTGYNAVNLSCFTTDTVKKKQNKLKNAAYVKEATYYKKYMLY